jgi:glutathione S-transferase
MASWTWVEQYHAQIGDLAAEYPHIAGWRARIGARPAVQRAMLVGTDGLPKMWNPSATR